MRVGILLLTIACSGCIDVPDLDIASERAAVEAINRRMANEVAAFAARAEHTPAEQLAHAKRLEELNSEAQQCVARLELAIKQSKKRGE